MKLAFFRPQRLNSLLLAATALYSFSHPAMADTAVTWLDTEHQAFYADINGDGMNDLLLQSLNHDIQSILIMGQAATTGIEYLPDHSQILDLQLTGQIINLADINGDQKADLTVVYPQQQQAISYLSSGTINSASSQFEYTTTQWPWLSDAGDYSLISGDFNGDGLADLLAHSGQKYRHQLLHSNAYGQLHLAQQINTHVKWGKGNAERLIVADYNGDGRDDIFALARQKNHKHYLVFSDPQGKLLNRNTESIDAKIDGEDWHDNGYSINISDIDGDGSVELIKMGNLPGGIDENGQLYEQNSNKPANKAYQPQNKTTTQVQTLVAAPADPGKYDYPVTPSGSYIAKSSDYNIQIHHQHAGATSYEIWEAYASSASATPSAYVKASMNSDGISSRFNHSTTGYYYYIYKACNGSACSAFSPYRRIYVYGPSGSPSSISISPSTVNVNQSYTITWGSANGSVDGTIYTLYESLNGQSEAAIHSVTRTSWTETSYSYNRSRSMGGNYTYRVRACNPEVACGGSVSKTQTVIAANAPPNANSDSASVNEDGSVMVNVLGNDSDSDGDSLSITGASSSKGSTSVNGSFISFYPFSNYHGSTTVAYTISDGKGGTDSAVIYVTVNPVNDSPTGSVSISGQASVGNTLTASQNLSDPDGLGSFSYRWYRNGTPINGATASSYTLTQDDASYKMSVTISYVDGDGTSESQTSSETAAVYSSIGSKQIRFVHTDLLGSPVAETGN